MYVWKQFVKEIKKNGFLYTFVLCVWPLYVLHVGTFPFALHGDEANIALQALAISHNQSSLIGVGWANLPLLSFVPHALTMALWGSSPVGLRMGSVIFALLTLFIIYFFAQLLFNRQVALFATFFLGISNIWIAYGRLGLTNEQATFVMLSALFFTVLGIQKGKLWATLVGGVFLGLCLYSYIAARIIIFILFPYIFLIIVESKLKSKILVHVISLIAVSFLVALPQGLFYFQNPGTFNARANDVYIFSSAPYVRQWLGNMYPHMNKVQIVIAQFFQTINIFAGDQAGQYGYKGQLFDWATIVFFLFGIPYVFLKSKKTGILLLSWLILVLLGSVLTSSPITVSRIIIGLPVIFLFAAVGFDSFITIVRKKTKYVFLIVLCIIVYITYFNVNTYFSLYAQKELNGQAGDINAFNATQIAYYLNTLPHNYTAIFLTPPNLYADFAPLEFLSPNSVRYDIHYPESYTFSQPCPSNTVYFVYPSYINIWQRLKNTCPNTISFDQKSQSGMLLYYVLQTNK